MSEASRSPDWSLDDARAFIDKIREAVKPAGWEVGLAGSVLEKGASKKDLDVILFPRQKVGPLDLEGLRTALKTIPGFYPSTTVEQIHAYWRKHGSADTKHVEVWRHRVWRRVDLMIMS